MSEHSVLDETARRSTSSTRTGGRPTAGSTSRAWPPASRRELELPDVQSQRPSVLRDRREDRAMEVVPEADRDPGDRRHPNHATTISGDMGWIASEGVFPLRPIGKAGTGSATWQIDEVEVRRSVFARPRSISVTTARGTRSGGCGTSTALPCRRRTSHARRSATPRRPRPRRHPWGEPLRVCRGSRRRTARLLDVIADSSR